MVDVTIARAEEKSGKSIRPDAKEDYENMLRSIFARAQIQPCRTLVVEAFEEFPICS